MIIEAFAAYGFECLISRLKSTKPVSLEKFEKILESEGSYHQYNNIQTTTKSPLFVTWNTIDNRRPEHHDLRGCIGTFQPLPLDEGVKEYSLIAAFNDHRFRPVTINEVSSLECAITVLSEFEPVDDPLDWIVGKHGIRASFTSNSSGRHYSSTFLPEVAEEYGWDQSTTLDHLADKAGCIRNDCDISVTRYQGLKGRVSYDKYLELRDKIEI